MINIKIVCSNPRFTIDEIKTHNNLLAMKKTPEGNAMKSVSIGMAPGNMEDSGIYIELEEDVDWLKYTLSKIHECIE